MSRTTKWASAAAAVLTLAGTAALAQPAGAREACRQAARVLVNQETRWNDSRTQERGGGSGTLYWRAADGTEGVCRVDRNDRVYEVRVERWGTAQDEISVWPGTGTGEGSRMIRCESQKGRRKECSIPRGARVRLEKQLSDTPCRAGRTWGFNRNEIWVDDGCRAVFEVTW
ncbi:MAG: DUF3011 domain-containing protein [Thermoanaerobaculia bacterium]|nr:DUF3011 domain-containing protein [Thermoanaerobaculia bacterium]MCZ7650443.1 DUF3011 domain-containing protein [Thermoanaerobaculia bacterium]